MNRERYEIELVTPCFLGGASQAAEWRTASIRGQLRWWFRAVAGASHPLEEVRRLETELFGDVNRSSAVRLRTFEGRGLVPTQNLPSARTLTAEDIARCWGDPSEKTQKRLRLKSGNAEIPSNPISYLAFGPITHKGVQRSYLPPGARAAFELVWTRKVAAETRKIFDQALWCWLHLGGIGSRSRKGLGSLRLLTPDQSRADLLRQVGENVPRGSNPLPEWTCFSGKSRIFLGHDQPSWSEALLTLGSWMIAFRRRYGNRNLETRSRNGVSLQERDYEWAAPSGRNPRAAIPDRAGFGLPLPFSRKNPNGTRVGEDVVWASPDGDARRASPLLLHVEKLGENRYIPVLTYLPARFLPASGRLAFERRRELFSPTPEQLDIEDRFLAHLLAPPSGQPLITEVRP